MEMILLEVRSSGGNGRDFAFDGKQVGTQHVRGQPRFRTEHIAVLHDFIYGSQVEKPELFHDLPGGSIEGRRCIWIVFTKLFQNKFLLGGMPPVLTGNRFSRCAAHFAPYVKYFFEKKWGNFK